MKLDTDDPIELGEFVSAFTALASQYDRFIRREKPDADPSATLFVGEIRQGCIEADLVPWIYGAAVGIGESISFSASLVTLSDFVSRYGQSLSFYKDENADNPSDTTAQLADFHDQVAAVASAPKSNLEVAALVIKDGEKEISSVFKFDTSEAKRIKDNTLKRRLEREKTSAASHPRVLLVFAQTSVKRIRLGSKRTGDRGIIESIAPGKDLALVYSSDLAEQRIKDEIRTAQDNIYMKGFEVDVNVEVRNGRPIAYRITNLHDVIDLPDDGSPD